jgi:hypothetical protein
MNGGMEFKFKTRGYHDRGLVWVKIGITTSSSSAAGRRG